MRVRRIVTGYNAAGKAVVKTDEQLTAVPRIGAGIEGCEIWSTDEMPVDNSPAADAAITELTSFIASGWTGMLTTEAPQSRRATRRTKHRSLHRDSAPPRESSRKRA